MEEDDFDRGFDELAPYQSIERRADPNICLRYLVSGQKIANDFEQFKNWWVKYSNLKEYKTIVVLDMDQVVGYASL